MSSTKHLRGSHLEGGGQIIRNSLVLSSLLLQPLSITNIRGNRPGGGGLKAQHLTGVGWLSKATASKTAGAEKKSKTLEFRPQSHQKYWREHKRQGGSTARVVEIDIGTPGSITLLLQAMLPYLIFTGRSGLDD
jgi:RNA 3'-terminal phosphate cyclase (ATP)